MRLGRLGKDAINFDIFPGYRSGQKMVSPHIPVAQNDE